ncbi:hypothetical protein D3C84_1031670 [compost metagenome]
MECSVKNNNLRHAGHVHFSCRNPHHCSRIVQRCKVEQLADLGLGIGINECGSLEEFAPVNHTVSNSVDLIDGGDYPVLLVGQTG